LGKEAPQRWKDMGMAWFAPNHPAKLNLPLAEQRRVWLGKFLWAFASVFVAYMAMYLIRNHFKAAQPLLKEQLGYTTTQLGQIGFAFSITYGIGKTLLGYVVDGLDSKRIVSVLLFLSALSVTAMGLLMIHGDRYLLAIMVMWGLSGCFQSVGGPLSYSTVTKWTPRSKRGRWLGCWNASHNVGGAIAGGFALWGATVFFSGSVVAMILFPCAVVGLLSGWTYFTGRDSPESHGLHRSEEIWEEPENSHSVASENLSKWYIFRQYVLKNPYIWLLCCANVFVYIIRIGIDNWAPLYTREVLHFSQQQAVQTIFWFEGGALFGSIGFGIISDWLGGRRCLVAALCMIAIFFAIQGYQHGTQPVVVYTSLFFLGALVFGPQLLVGVSLTGFAPKQATAVTNGLSGTFGYLLGDGMAKVGLARIADTKQAGLVVFGHVFSGWPDTFAVFYGALVVGTILFFVIAIGEERQLRTRRV
jgi:OPA family hexose phosphate transport protein UhpT-like MFS transporter